MGIISDTLQGMTSLSTEVIGSVAGIVDGVIGDYTISLAIAILVTYVPIVALLIKITARGFSPLKVAMLEGTIALFIGGVTASNGNEEQLQMTVMVLMIIFVIAAIGRLLFGGILGRIFDRAEEK